MRKFFLLLCFALFSSSFVYGQLYRVTGSKSVELNGSFFPTGFNVGSDFIYSLNNSFRLYSGFHFKRSFFEYSDGLSYLGNSSLALKLYSFRETLFFDATLGFQFGIEHISNEVFNPNTSFVINESIGLNIEYLFSRRFSASAHAKQVVWQFSNIHAYNLYLGFGVNYIFGL